MLVSPQVGRFDAVQIETPPLWQGPAADMDVIRSQLLPALDLFRQERRLSVWLNTHIKDAALMSVAHDLDFEFHHAAGDKAVLYSWLPDNEESRVPPLATHQIGVAGVCLDQEGRVLVVREARSGFSTNPWKFPGGLASAGEDFGLTATREVEEETGVHSKFCSLLCLRHQHGLRFGTSDLYIMCRLKPLTLDVQPCATEIGVCVP